MNHWQPTRRAALAALGVFALPLASRAAAPGLPGDSIYQVHASLVDQDGRAFELDSARGTPLLVSLFYTSCQMVCPMIFETIHATLKALPAEDRKAMRVLMISFDPARDSVEVLKKTATQRSCDAQWTLARGNEATVRKIAAVLGVQYRRLADGEFNHSTLVTLLDREGRIAAKTGKLGSVDAAMVKAVHRVTALG
jgi:protein SCO1/2